MQLPDYRPPPAPPSPLAVAIHELSAVGIRVTPLSVLGWATDRGLSDAEIDRIVDQLAAAGSTEAAA